MPDITKIAIVGLGYVGLPLAVALARHFPLVGFDADAKRIDELNAGEDRTREIAAKDLKASSADFTYEAGAIAGADIYLITVPTPVDAANLPDLSAVRTAKSEQASTASRTPSVISVSLPAEACSDLPMLLPAKRSKIPFRAPIRSRNGFVQHVNL